MSSHLLRGPEGLLRGGIGWQWKEWLGDAGFSLQLPAYTISLLRAGANSDDSINSWVFTWDPEGAELGSVTRIHFRWDFLTVISDQGDG